MPRALFTALISSSTLTTSGSYFTTASFVSNDTLTSFTPFTASSADCTVDAQEPQVMPLTVRVTVASLAAREAANKSPTTHGVSAAKKLLLFISISSGAHCAPVFPSLNSLTFLAQPEVSVKAGRPDSAHAHVEKAAPITWRVDNGAPRWCQGHLVRQLKASNPQTWITVGQVPELPSRLF